MKFLTKEIIGSAFSKPLLELVLLFVVIFHREKEIEQLLLRMQIVVYE